MGGPLEGIRILDLSQWQQGPYATVLLSDLGAEVVKVEKPLYGDQARHAFGGHDPDTVAPDFFAHNRGKRGITVELSHPQGRELVLRLSERMDVVINNFRFGMMEEWGLGYDAFRERNPRIIFARASGMGPKGPEAQRPMFDIVAQALGGIMSINGEEGSAPTPIGTFMADQSGATMLALAILAAIVARERTGKGQSIDVSLLGSHIAMQSYEITDYLFTKQLPRRAGRGHPHSGVLWNTFPAADGYFSMAGVREDRWDAFCELIDAPELIHDPRFNCHQARNENREALIKELDAVFQRQTRDYWTEVLAQLNIACGPVRTYAEVAEDPQVLSNEYITEMDNPHGGRVQLVNTPIAFSETPVRPQGFSPELGQHTEEVLLEMGMDWPEILALREAGAI